MLLGCRNLMQKPQTQSRYVQGCFLPGDGDEGALSLFTHSAPSSFLTYASEHSWQNLTLDNLSVI